MTTKVIAFDLDGVVFNDDLFFSCINKAFPLFDRHQQTSYDLENAILKQGAANGISILDEHRFYEKYAGVMFGECHAYPETVQLIKELQNFGVRVVYLTARTANRTNHEATVKAFARAGLQFKDVYFLGNKSKREKASELGATLIIEDKGETVKDCTENGNMQAILIKRPYNQSLIFNERVAIVDTLKLPELYRAQQQLKCFPQLLFSADEVAV